MPERRGFARRGTASSSLSSFLRLLLFYLSVSVALPSVNSFVSSRALPLHVYLMRVHAEIFACAHVSKTYRGRRRERKAVAARMHARGRARTHAQRASLVPSVRTHACALRCTRLILLASY